MNKMLLQHFLILLSLSVLIGCHPIASDRKALDYIYEEYGVTGSFILYNTKVDKYTYINYDRTQEGFLPCSTFKIPNSIIALEEGIIPNENHILRWDGETRENEQWNKDHDLRSAFSQSVVWYYQALARDIGQDRMERYLKRFHYGNGGISSGIDKFWLEGRFRVTQQQQIALLKALFNQELPVSTRTQSIVKSIMLYEKRPEGNVYAKTGMCYQGIKTIGWFIGSVETPENTFIFANNIEKFNPDKRFIQTRIESTFKILEELKVLETD
tara:strand:+ start:66 stop:875 length:810 start_codon:yes stop_codon:yes gene_type:complete